MIRKTAEGLALFFAGLLVFTASSQAAPKTRHDSKQPVEIIADSLEVQQNERVAFFSGNVEATQGSLKLNTARLVVHYSPGARQASSDSNEIEKLEAQGGVVMARPSENATGDWAIYDVTGRFLTMGGHVVLTREGNVVRGSKLTLDLDTGVSRIEGAPASTDTGAKPRVRSLFTPAEKKPDTPSGR